jgi:hypothetical protein
MSNKPVAADWRCADGWIKAVYVATYVQNLYVDRRTKVMILWRGSWRTDWLISFLKIARINQNRDRVCKIAFIREITQIQEAQEAKRHAATP